MITRTSARGDVAILIPAAGLGVRMGPGAPKALRLLRGEPLLVHAVRGICAAPSVGAIVVAAPPGEVDAVAAMLTGITATPRREELAAKPVASSDDGAADKTASNGIRVASGGTDTIIVVTGGATRRESVAAALSAVPAEFDLVLVHDAARALTPPELFEAVAAAVRAGGTAVIPVLPVVDTIKRVGSAGEVLATVDRAPLRAVQTPQGFRRATLTAAHAAAAHTAAGRAAAGQAAAGGGHTDDAGMVEALGGRVDTVAGSDLAFKVTRPFDLAVAEAVLERRVGS